MHRESGVLGGPGTPRFVLCVFLSAQLLGCGLGLTQKSRDAVAREQIVVYLQRLNHWRIESLTRLDDARGSDRELNERWIERLDQSIALFQEQIAEIDGTPQEKGSHKQKGRASVNP